jgi:kynurenine formamidase
MQVGVESADLSVARVKERSDEGGHDVPETNAVCIAVDTLSLDHGPSADFATHYAWLPAGRYGIECLAGLDMMPAAGATLMVGAPKVRNGTGGPARVMALV